MIFITGGAKGIGKALVKEFQEDRVYFCDTDTIAMSLSTFRITVNAIAPGWIHVREEEILREEDHNFHPSGRVGKPEDISRLAKFLCEPENDFINGRTFTVDGGVTRKMIYPE